MGTPGIKEVPKVVVTPYLGAKAGVQKNTDVTFNTNSEQKTEDAGIRAQLGINGGVKIEKGNLFVDANATAGTSVGASVTAGYNQPIYKTLGLELSANAQGQKELLKSTAGYDEFYMENGEFKCNSALLEYRDGFFQAGAKAQVTFRDNRGHFKMGLGAEGGYRYSGINSPVPNIQPKEEGLYITPTGHIEVSPGKNHKVTFIVDADKYSGNLGIKYNF